MFYDERADRARRLIADYVRSPSLQHMRDPHSIGLLADRIVDAIDRKPSVWAKWEGLREDVIRAAACCWIPLGDLLAFLNGLPGPRLTDTDVDQRLKAIYAEPYERYPDEDFRDGCLAVYELEKAKGTEMPAIVGALCDHLEVEEERRRREREEAGRRRREEEQLALEQRFLSGADCKWISIRKSADLYCRKNGRGYRLSQTKEKRWNLFRIEGVNDKGRMVGLYGTRGDASKALAKLAYEPEPRW